MIRYCDGTDPNLLGGDGRTPCACGLRFDDVKRLVVFPHEEIRKTALHFSPGELWMWPAPSEGEVPDYPPTLLGLGHVETLYLERPDPDASGERNPDRG